MRKRGEKKMDVVSTSYSTALANAFAAAAALPAQIGAGSRAIWRNKASKQTASTYEAKPRA